MDTYTNLALPMCDRGFKRSENEENFESVSQNLYIFGLTVVLESKVENSKNQSL